MGEELNKYIDKKNYHTPAMYATVLLYAFLGTLLVYFIIKMQRFGQDKIMRP